MRKILIISPTPTHSPNAGNRVHINLLSKFLKANLYDVHFLYLCYEDYNAQQMEAEWGDKLHIFNREQLYAKGPLVQYYLKRLFYKSRRIFRHLHKLQRVINKHQFQFNSEVDSQFPGNIKKDIQLLQDTQQFGIVICEYAFLSKALTFFDDSVLKVLDTHDKFTDRFKLYLNNNLKPDWVSLDAHQERKALQRADLIISLKEEDRQYFEKLSSKKAICFFSVPIVETLPLRSFEKKLLYFASGNTINLKTLDYFEENILPKVIIEHPSVRLLVGGSICQVYKHKNKATLLMGQFEDASDFYKLGDIVINPELEGTGFKIKTLEALSYELPVVCTRPGAAGLLGNRNDHLILSDIKNFETALNEALGNDLLRNETKLRAREWIYSRRQKMGKELLEQLER